MHTPVLEIIWENTRERGRSFASPRAAASRAAVLFSRRFSGRSLSFVNFAGCALVIHENAGKRYSDKSIPLAICDTFGIRTENEWNMCKRVHTFSRKEDNII